jgi:PucR C-terminal helix-turn-helix domain/GGDEF-like domain
VETDPAPDGTMARSYRPRLGQLLEVLGPHVVSACHLPVDCDLPVAEPIVYDPNDELAEHPDGILLAVGVHEDTPGATDLVREAGRRGYRAIVVKDRGAEPADLAEAAREAGIALLLAPSALAWRQLDALITAALSVPGSAAASYASVGMGDLFSLANAIAATVGGAASVEDPQGNILAYSNLPGQEIDEIRTQGILGRKTPARPTNRVEYSRVFRAEGAVRFASLGDGHIPRLAVAVRAGTHLLGYLWVLDGAPPVVPNAERLLEEAARLAALHLLHARTPSDPQRRQRAEALRALLEGDVSEAVAADRLQLPADGEYVVIAFSPSEPDGEPGLAAARVLDMAAIAAEGWHASAACTTCRDRVYALLPIAPRSTPARLRRFAEDTVRTVRASTQLSLYAGIGPGVHRLGDTPKARHLADRVVEVLEGTPGVAVASEEQLRSRIALIELAADDGAATGYLLDPVRRMVDYDTEHETSHAETLLAYLNAFGDAGKAASVLFVHENTLRYRIRRLQEMFDVDLADPTERLVTWLQLRLLLGDLPGNLSKDTTAAQ